MIKVRSLQKQTNKQGTLSKTPQNLSCTQKKNSQYTYFRQYDLSRHSFLYGEHESEILDGSQLIVQEISWMIRNSRSDVLLFLYRWFPNSLMIRQKFISKPPTKKRSLKLCYKEALDKKLRRQLSYFISQKQWKSKPSELAQAVMTPPTSLLTQFPPFQGIWSKRWREFLWTWKHQQFDLSTWIITKMICTPMKDLLICKYISLPATWKLAKKKEVKSIYSTVSFPNFTT